MSKTPEEMAEDILQGVGKVASELWGDDEQAKKFAEAIRSTWLAGYQAAKDTYKDAISAYEDVAKQMLEEAVRIMSPKEQLANADKVMPQWISVKERLPEEG